MIDNGYNLRPIWDELLAIYEAVRQICDRHGFRYYANAGTAIGAMRHKGFIPWDDDLDLYMPRPDYEAFLKVADAELPSYWRQMTWRNSKSYDQMFGKVMETRREVVDRVVRESGLPLAQGLFIDIFPLDGVPASKIRQILFKIYSRVVNIRIDYVLQQNIPTGLKGVVKRMIGAALWLMFPCLRNLKNFQTWAERHFLKCPFEGSRYCEIYWLFGKDNRVYETEWFSKMEFVPFDNTTIPVPHKWNEYLTRRFGDWHSLPPVDQQHPMHGNREEVGWRFGPDGDSYAAQS